jgi:hypothetical protein
VLEHERSAIEDNGDARLDETITAIMHLQATIGAALESLVPPSDNARHG